MTYFRYALRFLAGFFLLLLLLGGVFILGGSYLPFGNTLLVRGVNFFGASHNLALAVDKAHGDPLRGYALEKVLVTWDNRPLFRAASLDITFSLKDLLREGSFLQNLKVQEWSLDLDTALAMPSTSGGFSLKYLPRNVALEEGSLELDSQSYALPRLLAELQGDDLLLLSEASARLGSPEPLSLLFRGEMRFHGDALSLTEGELFLQASDEGDPHLLLSGDLLPRQKLALLFSAFPLDSLGRASLLREISQILGTLKGSLSGSALLEGSLPGEWNAATDIRISQGSLGGICLSSLNLRGSGGNAEPLEVFFEGTAPSGGFLEGSLLAPEFPEGAFGLSFTGTSLDLALGEVVDSRLASLSGIVPSLRGSYLQKDGITSGNVVFSGVQGSYGDLSFKNFQGAMTLSQDRLESSLEGLLENLPLTGGGTVYLAAGKAPEMDLFLRSPGTPLHRLRAILPDLEPFRLEGNLAWEILFRGTPQDPVASGKLHSERIRIRGELLESPEVTLNYKKEILSLQKARVLWKDLLLEGEGEIRDLFQSREMTLQASALPQGNRWAREILSREVQEFLLPMEGGKLSLNLKGTPEKFQGSLSGILPPLRTALGTTGRGSLKASLGPNSIEISSLELPLASGGLSLKGSVTRSSSGTFHPSLDGEIRRIALDPLESSGIPLKGLLEGTFQVRGSLARPELRFSLSSPEMAFQEYRGSNLSCRGILSPEVLRIEEARGQFWEGEVILRGTLDPLGKSPKLNLEGDFAKIDLMRTQDLLDAAKIYLKGTAGGTLAITGSPESPRIALEITSPKLLLNSLPLEDVSATLRISPEEIRLDPLVVHAGSSPVTISAVMLPKKSWNTSFTATGDSLDLAALLQSWELATPETPFFPQGKLDLHVQGDVRNGKLLGKGSISSSELFAGTLRGEKIHLPFVFDENSFTLKNGSLSFYEGTLRGEGSVNYAEKPALWKAQLSGENIQVSSLMKDLHPLSGDISGTGAFGITLNGPLNYLFMTNGEGHVTIQEGAFSGFPQLAPLLTKAPKPQLDFASLQIYFSVDGRTLYFVPGSRLTAPPGNTIYRYFAADGFLPFTGRPMNINCITEINAPAINAFLGAFAGFLETIFLTKDISQLGSLTNLTQAVEDALIGGIFGRLAKSDFREISFSLKGTMEKPEMANLSIAPKQGAFLLNPQDKDKGDRKQDFQLSFSFPTGEGKKTSDDVSGQLKDQIFEQAIKQIIPLGN